MLTQLKAALTVCMVAAIATLSAAGDQAPRLNLVMQEKLDHAKAILGAGEIEEILPTEAAAWRGPRAEVEILHRRRFHSSRDLQPSNSLILRRVPVALLPR
jgi:hypothetical protein